MQPTVLTDTTPDMTVVSEEVFGPVLAVMRFADEQEAVALANGSRYGLAAGVWTAVAHALRAGTVWVNSYRVVSPAGPFGGPKASGIGRESVGRGPVSAPVFAWLLRGLHVAPKWPPRHCCQ